MLTIPDLVGIPTLPEDQETMPNARTPHPSPSSPTISLFGSDDSDSDKENIPPIAATDFSTITWNPRDWASTSTPIASPSQASPEERAIQEKLTFKTFEEFVQEGQRRAELWDELSERSCHSLLQLLVLFHETTKGLDDAQSCETTRQYVENYLARLSNDLKEAVPLLYPTGTCIPAAMFSGYGIRAVVARRLLESGKQRTHCIIESYQEQRKILFRLLEHLNLAYHGNLTFVRHGYLRPNLWRTTGEDNISNGWQKMCQWKLQWEADHPGEQFEYDNPTYNPYWEESCPNSSWESSWMKVNEEQLYKDFIDPQHDARFD
jgi:hypothetical protein